MMYEDFSTEGYDIDISIHAYFEKKKKALVNSKDVTLVFGMILNHTHRHRILWGESIMIRVAS